jgi:hypothetical protein
MKKLLFVGFMLVGCVQNTPREYEYQPSPSKYVDRSTLKKIGSGIDMGFEPQKDSLVVKKAIEDAISRANELLPHLKNIHYLKSDFLLIVPMSVIAKKNNQSMEVFGYNFRFSLVGEDKYGNSQYVLETGDTLVRDDGGVSTSMVCKKKSKGLISTGGSSSSFVEKYETYGTSKEFFYTCDD